VFELGAPAVDELALALEPEMATAFNELPLQVSLHL